MEALTGKVAVVTGGTRGIGLACAKALAARGCRVVVGARTAPPAGCPFEFVPFNACVPGTWDAIFAEACQAEILVNNVGGGGRWGQADPLTTDFEVWDDVYAKNVIIARALTLAAVRHMLRGGWGRVITIGSLLGSEGAGRPWFMMAKAAQLAMMKALAKQTPWIRAGLTFNTVSPGAIAIPGTGWDAEAAAHAATLPLGRLGHPEDVAAVVGFLASPEAAYVNGANWRVDGGEGDGW